MDMLGRDAAEITNNLESASVKISIKAQLALYDFVERVGSTAAEAGLAVYVTQKNPDVSTILVASATAAAKYLLVQLNAWKLAHGVS